MSMIASFYRLPISAVDGLREAFLPKKRWFGRPRHTYGEYLRQRGREVVEYPWQGFVLATLLVYLQEERGIDLLGSEYRTLTDDLSMQANATVIILTQGHRQACLTKLEQESFSEDQLRDYYNAFNEVSWPDSGKPMLDGVRAFREALEQVDEDAVIFLVIG